MKETEDIYRLYHREWVTAYSVSVKYDQTEHPGGPIYPAMDAAREWAEENLTGRVKAEEIRFDAQTDNKVWMWVHVKVFKDNLKGEFRERNAAELTSHIKGYEEYTIVVRNSRADHAICDYGRVKLPEGS